MVTLYLVTIMFYAAPSKPPFPSVEMYRHNLGQIKTMDDCQKKAKTISSMYPDFIAGDGRTVQTFATCSQNKKASK